MTVNDCEATVKPLLSKIVNSRLSLFWPLKRVRSSVVVVVSKSSMTVNSYTACYSRARARMSAFLKKWTVVRP